jgi:peptide-methionine (R)-S-oxide reductase
MKKIRKSDEDWRQQLTNEQFDVCRNKGTERPFTGEYEKSKETGVFACVCCGQELFSSSDKFDSGTGWPSFWKPVAEDAVETKPDRGLFTARTEVLCPRCDAHLGHVFDDGPPPTGMRYCINSVSLKLKPEPEQS